MFEHKTWEIISVLILKFQWLQNEVLPDGVGQEKGYPGRPWHSEFKRNLPLTACQWKLHYYGARCRYYTLVLPLGNI